MISELDKSLNNSNVLDQKSRNNIENTEDSITHHGHDGGKIWTLVFGALGVVYGDIGTSPLYAFRECFTHGHLINPNHDNVLGILSLIFWAVLLIVCLKYLILVLKADNRGEGGILALMALSLQKNKKRAGFMKWAIITPALFGSALLYGDGAITPAISVLSAVEGLSIVTDKFQPYILFVTVVIITLLFGAQKNGTAKVGAVFGPIITLWFLTIGGLGFYALLSNPEILWAINPYYAINFFNTNGLSNITVLGSVFLALTGAEALYADMGHFGKKPIRIGWFSLVMPALLLNYFGQGALVLSSASAISNPFFLMAPQVLVFPLVVLATAATVIASQALISGAFSLTNQAIQLGYMPRLFIKHTSETERGQIYIPFINWGLYLITIILVLSFKTSSSLAAAYGIAVSATMVITTFLVMNVAVGYWKWTKLKTAVVFLPLLLIDVCFLTANSTKFFHAGWVPIVLGLLILFVMTTWHTGRRILHRSIREQVPAFEQFFSHLQVDQIIRIEGTAIFMIRDLHITPPALIFNIRHNKVLHEKVVLLSVITEEKPHVRDPNKILQVYSLGNGFYRIVIHTGFMENPDVPDLISKAGLEIDLKEATFFTDRVRPIPTDRPGMALWREKFFAFLSQNSQRPISFYRIPVEQVIEIGFQVEI